MDSQSLAMSAFTGLLRGKKEREEKNALMEEKKAAMALQKEMLKIQLEQAKAAQAQMAQKQAFIQRLFPDPGAGGLGQIQQGNAPAFSERFDGGAAPAGQQPAQPQVNTDLIDMLTGLNPMQQEVLKEVTGINIPGATEAARKRQQDQIANQFRVLDAQMKLIAQRQQEAEYNRGFSEGSWQQQDSPTGDGSKVWVKLPKYGAGPPMGGAPASSGPLTGPGGAPRPPGGGSVAALPPVEDFKFINEEDGKEYSVIRNKRTGEYMTTPVLVKGLDKETTEYAGRMAMANNAKKMIDDMKSMLFDKNGDIKKQVLLEMSAPGGGFGTGRKVKSIFRDAIDARIRAATGAGMPAQEMDVYMNMYLPSVGDLTSPGLAENKLQRLDEFMTSFLTVLDPTGRAQKRLEKPGNEKSGGTIRLRWNPQTGRLE